MWASALAPAHALTSGATSVPKSSIERITSAWGRVPTLNWIRKRSWPKIECWKRIFSATSAGEPTRFAPSIRRLASNAARLIGGQPRSRPIRSIIRAKAGKAMSAASCEVGARKPWELMLSAGGGAPTSAAASACISAKGLKRAGSPPMIASAIGRPRRPVRIADCGEPPTATQTGSGSCSGRG